MNQNSHKLAIWSMWLALPITALSYWRAWDQLPMRMAVHFDADWQPNGWTSREGSLMFSLGVVAFLLVVFTIAAYAVSMQKPGSTGPVLIGFYLALGLFLLASHWVVQRNSVQRNLHGSGRAPQSMLLCAEFPHV
jgi:hypothetical protein